LAIIEREPWYVTREAVQAALDVASTARTSARIDECIAAASRDVDGLTHRVFYPWTGTRYFDWPDQRGSFGYRLWLNADELVDVTTVVSGGETITDYFAGPSSTGVYNRIEVNRDTLGVFNTGDTPQRSIAITGTYCGCELRDRAAGALADALNSSDTTFNVTDGSLVGVGSVLRVDSERMQVTAKGVVDSTTTLSGNVNANNGTTTIPVASGAAVNAGEVILVGAERMLVTDVAGNNLIVKRPWDGTVLAAHSTSDVVYVYRRVTVTRGDLGTTAASHLDAAPIRAHVPPALVSELTLAYALNMLLQGRSAYSAVVGSGENQREASGRGVRALADDTMRAYGRHGRMRSA